MVAFDPEVSVSVDDVTDVARANALLATLGIEQTMQNGGDLPPFFHQAYFWQPEPASALGRDGHPKTGSIIPDMGLPQRMWAGGRLAFETPLRAGICSSKTTQCESAVLKTGRTGPLGFVTLRHEIRQQGVLCITEWQDLVYRAEPDPGASQPDPPQARTDETHVTTVAFGSTMLFRYSALTFNGHRIHYDLPYARQVEGYAGLVVHGPLLAQLLMLQAVQNIGPLSAFSFRATAPLMDFERAELCMAGSDMWVRGPDGRQCMAATATAQA